MSDDNNNGSSGCGCFGCLIPIVGFVLLAGVGVYFAINSFSTGVHQEAMDTLKGCTLTQETLGDDVKLRFGMFSGSSNSTAASGEASWQYPVQGNDAQGMFNWDASRDDGPWTFNSAILESEGTTIDVLTCQYISIAPTEAVPVENSKPDPMPGEIQQPNPGGTQQPGMPNPGGVQQPGMPNPGGVQQPGMPNPGGVQQPGMQPGDKP